MSLRVGDKVRCSATHDWNGTSLASFVRTTVYTIIEIGTNNPDRIVIGLNGVVTAAVDRSTLTNATPMAQEPETPYVPPAEPEIEAPDQSGAISTSVDNAALSADASNLPIRDSVFDPSLSTIDGVNGKVMGVTGRYDAFVDTSESYSIGLSSQKNKIYSMDNTINAIEKQYPSVVQNNEQFPKKLFYDDKLGYYKYDYSMDYDSDELDGVVIGSDMSDLRRSLNIDILTRPEIRKKMFDAYNRYKLANPNDLLTKSFAHVFFVRPDCNIFSEGSYKQSILDPKLNQTVGITSEFYYALKHSPDLLRQLVQADAGYNHDFSMFLSNAAKSFEIADEYIESDEFTPALTGHKIPYGRHNIESKTSGKFSVNYKDTRDLYIYNLHKLWIDYISNVFRGKFYPKISYIMNKILDYTSSVYYVVCAEDGETVIFWSKYWGVFPLEAPSSSFSFTADSKETMNNPDLKIQYTYAYKEDFNPLSLIEFNSHSDMSDLKYVRGFQKNKLGAAYTWSGAPFIETFNNVSGGMPYTFKLRFRPE